MDSLLKRFEAMRTFTPDEAWKIYKLSAFLEAFGWSILITGLLISKYKILPRDVAVPIAGQIHGMIFIAYFLALVFVYPSLKWSRAKTITAFLAGIPPYGSLAFELWANRNYKMTIKDRKIVNLLISDGRMVIAIQPAKGLTWKLPYVETTLNQSTLEAVSGLCRTILGYSLKIKLISHDAKSYTYAPIDSININKIDLLNCSINEPGIDELAIVPINQVLQLGVCNDKDVSVFN